MPSAGYNSTLIRNKNTDKMMGHSCLYLNRIISGTLGAMTGLKTKQFVSFFFLDGTCNLGSKDHLKDSGGSLPPLLPIADTAHCFSLWATKPSVKVKASTALRTKI